jgi:hypothetical protein
VERCGSSGSIQLNQALRCKNGKAGIAAGLNLIAVRFATAQ